jgi:glycosyltransferase involved in cell wall biosynthesis
MPALLAGYDIVVLPSYREGTPKVLLEAAAMGKPLIATDVPGCRGVVQNGINGLLVPPKDATALAQAIEVLVCDHELRVAYGRAGRQLMLDRFEESIVLDSTLEIYGELISLPRQS